MRHHINWCVLGFAVAFTGSVNAKSYTDVKAAMIEAIDAPNGAVTGTLDGPIAEQISKTTKSADPVLIEVTTLKAFTQEGCKQLKVILRQRNVPTVDGKLGVFEPHYQWNMCRDGQPPTEGMDLDTVTKALGAQKRPAVAK